MSISSYLKKKTAFFVVTLIMIICAVFISLNVKNTVSVSDRDIVINNNNLQIIYEDAINGPKNSLYPLSYEQGNSLSPANKIKIINNSNLSTNYSIFLIPKNNDENCLDVNKVYYSIDDSDPKILGSINNYEIYTSKIGKRKRKEINIKFWAGSELIDNSDAGKILDFEIKVK